MSMVVFMPPPAPLITGGGGGGTVLDGMITVGDYFSVVFGWSDGSQIDPFGSLSGDAAPYFFGLFIWDPVNGNGNAVMSGDHTGSVLSFQGETYIGVYNGEYDRTGFLFGPEVATWPTSGTHPFTLTLP